MKKPAIYGRAQGMVRVFGVTQFDHGLIASIAAAFVSTAGLLSMAMLGDWGRRNSAYFSAFAIGVLTVAVGFHLIPEALSESSNAWVAIVIGFIVMFSIGLILRSIARRRHDNNMLAFGFASIIALGTHSFLDGVIYEASFHEHLFTGGIATIGLLLHEFPEGVIAFFLLREAGLRPAAAGLYAFVAASLTTIAGALLAGQLINTSTEIPISALMGVTAGGLIYIILFHLGPHARLTPNRRGYDMASIGVIIGVAALILRHI